MAWCWSENELNKVKFTQEMSEFNVPIEKFNFIPQKLIEPVVDAFLFWCFNNNGYTERYQINIYDPLRDGYLAMVRVVLTKVLPEI